MACCKNVDNLGGRSWGCLMSTFDLCDNIRIILNMGHNNFLRATEMWRDTLIFYGNKSLGGYLKILHFLLSLNPFSLLWDKIITWPKRLLEGKLGCFEPSVTAEKLYCYFGNWTKEPKRCLRFNHTSEWTFAHWCQICEATPAAQ